MDRRTLILLTCGVVVLMFLVVFIGNVMGGLPSETVALIEAETTNLERDLSTFDNEKRAVEGAIQAEAPLFLTLQEGWNDRLQVAEERLGEAQKDLDRVRLLREEDKREAHGEVDELLTGIRAARIFAVNEASEMSSAAKFRVDFKQNRAQKVQALRGLHESVAGTNFSAVRSLVEQAALDWPAKGDDLEGRLALVTQMVDRANEAWQTIQQEDAKLEAGGSGKDVNFDGIIEAATVLTDLNKTVPASTAQIGELIPQLYRSRDKILEDMEIREGLDVTFHQKFKIVEVQIKDVAAKENEPTVREEWHQVSSSDYKKMEKVLGMAVERKSAGMYDHEAERIAQPAGYAYMAPPSQERNQYGHWQHGSGGSFWVFYGQYAFMRNMFWGPRYYRPTYSRDYNNYRATSRAGRTYYGTDASGKPRYGTGGSFTNSRYASSSYNRTGGFRNSRYVTSGGTYRGSRASSSSRTMSVRGSSRSSGSRFGGGK